MRSSLYSRSLPSPFNTDPALHGHRAVSGRLHHGHNTTSTHPATTVDIASPLGRFPTVYTEGTPTLSACLPVATCSPSCRLTRYVCLSGCAPRLYSCHFGVPPLYALEQYPSVARTPPTVHRHLRDLRSSGHRHSPRCRGSTADTTRLAAPTRAVATTPTATTTNSSLTTTLPPIQFHCRTQPPPRPPPRLHSTGSGRPEAVTIVTAYLFAISSTSTGRTTTYNSPASAAN